MFIFFYPEYTGLDDFAQYDKDFIFNWTGIVEDFRSSETKDGIKLDTLFQILTNRIIYVGKPENKREETHALTSAIVKFMTAYVRNTSG